MTTEDTIPVTMADALELSEWVIPIGDYQGRTLDCIRLGHLRYLVNMRRTRGTNSRPVRVRSSVKEKVSQYLAAISKYSWNEILACTECGTFLNLGKARGSVKECEMCGSQIFIARRIFMGDDNGKT